MITELDEQTVYADALIYDLLMAEDVPGEPGYPWSVALLEFDWQAAWDEALPVEPWHWDWKSPLREQMEALIGRPDVTSWTHEASNVLREILQAPVSEQPSLLGLRDSATQLLPAVSDGGSDAVAAADDPITVSAEEHDE